MDASSWFTDTITIESPIGLSATGTRDVAWGNRRAIRARVTAGQRRVETADGQVLMAAHTIRTDQPVDVKDRIWLPGATVGDAKQARKPLQVTSTKAKASNYTLYRVEL